MTRFVLYVGPMFSGKTTSLLAELDRYKFKNKKILLIKPKIDERYSVSKVCTHSGQSMDSVSINYINDFKSAGINLLNYDVLAVDEAFMIPNISNFLKSLYAQGMTIVVSSLDLSSSLEPFDEIQKMMPYATEIYKCTSICGKENCYNDAHLTYKLDGVGERASGEIEVGGAEMYEPRCHAHHPLLGSLK